MFRASAHPAVVLLAGLLREGKDAQAVTVAIPTGYKRTQSEVTVAELRSGDS
ncbi:MAG: hypothetical protein LBC99_01065 [Spirochaetota bacterium]|jgi:hypothetical protein|nr:hypothetical protein [Spirochaetota bacterium]